jgi:tryptophan synthase alpha chain
MKKTINIGNVPLSFRREVRGEVSNRFDKVFADNKKNLLNIFCTAGYPHRESTTEVMLALQKHGADMIEIGMPYSDPIADGPVIQHSNMIALQNGMTIQLLFEQLNRVKEKIIIPVILMGYLNPVLQYGMEKFCADAATAAVDAVILPDLPMFEFENFYKQLFKKHGLKFIFLITPETSNDRIKKADKLSSGFLYAVSSSATTGNTADTASKEKYFKRLAAMELKNPFLVGFGINDNQSFAEACVYAAGAIIGSAYIKILEYTTDIDTGTASFIKAIRSNE